jgi:2-desacetyl-2-hydroxyethyl bacteriochlorophyllide A dehydrogenase
MSRQMRAMVVTAYDAPLVPRDLAAPELTRGHALLEVLTCGVCFSDVKIARGRMPFSPDLALPHVPGHEICARVLETDPAGALEPGAMVVVHNVWPCRRCDRCRAGQENICRTPEVRAGFTEPGGFQERLVAPIDRLTPVPPGIDAVHAAPLTCALGTAYRSVLTRGGVTAGTRVAIIGLGGVGIHALQIARAAGARAAGIDRSGPAVTTAVELGLDAHRADDPDLEADLHARTAGEGFDVVVDTVGHGGSIEQADRLVRPGGRIVAVGYALGEALALPAPRLVLDEVELIGSRYVLRDELERAIRLVADGRVRVVVDRVEPLEAANEAFAALEGGEVVGRVVLDVAGVS